MVGGYMYMGAIATVAAMMMFAIKDDMRGA